MSHITRFYVQHYLTSNPSDWNLKDIGVICWMFHPNNNSDEIKESVSVWGESFVKELRTNGRAEIYTTNCYTIKILPIEKGIKIKKANEIHIYVKDVSKFCSSLRYDTRTYYERLHDTETCEELMEFVKFGDRIILKDEILTLQF